MLPALIFLYLSMDPIPPTEYPIPSLYRLAFVAYTEKSPCSPRLPAVIQEEIRVWNLLCNNEKWNLMIRWEMSSALRPPFQYLDFAATIRQKSVRMMVWMIRRYQLWRPLSSIPPEEQKWVSLQISSDQRIGRVSSYGPPEMSPCQYWAPSLVKKAIKYRSYDCLVVLLPFLDRDRELRMVYYLRALKRGFEQGARLLKPVEIPSRYLLSVLLAAVQGDCLEVAKEKLKSYPSLKKELLASIFLYDRPSFLPLVIPILDPEWNGTASYKGVEEDAEQVIDFLLYPLSSFQEKEAPRCLKFLVQWCNRHHGSPLLEESSGYLLRERAVIVLREGRKKELRVLRQNDPHRFIHWNFIQGESRGWS